MTAYKDFHGFNLRVIFYRNYFSTDFNYRVIIYVNE